MLQSAITLYNYTAEDHANASVYIDNRKLNVNFNSLPTTFRKYNEEYGLVCKAMKTNGNRACAIHSVFGRPSEARGHQEMFKDNARTLAATCLGESANALMNVGIDKVHIDAICNSFWMELAKPYLQGENTNEGKLLWEALRKNDPALAQECKDCLTTSNADARASATSKQKLLKDSTSFFVQDEKHVG